GFFLRGVVRPLDFGSNLSSSGTIPTALEAPGAAGMRWIIAQKRRRRRPNLRRQHSEGIVSSSDARAPRVLHACDAISNTLPGVCDRAGRIPCRPRASLPATCDTPRFREHPNCDSPFLQDRRLCAPVLPARAFHARLAAPSSPAHPLAPAAQPTDR